MNIKKLIKSKTFWLGVSTAAGGAVMCTNGHVAEGVEAIVAGLAIIFIRDAISKGQ